MSAPASTWATGPINRSGRFAYVHLIRAEGDPERRARVPVGSKGSDPTAKWRRELKKTTREEWAVRILAHLLDEEPRTFNRIGVELLDKTADILHATPFEAGLIHLVDVGNVEQTLSAPVYYRRRVLHHPEPGESVSTQPAERVVLSSKLVKVPGKAPPGYVWLRAKDINLDHQWNSRAPAVDVDAEKEKDKHLESSIRIEGLLQSPEVRKLDVEHEGQTYPSYWANFGFRRVRVIRDRIDPDLMLLCKVQNQDGASPEIVDLTARFHNLTENAERENLKMWEVAEALYQIQKIHGLSGPEIAMRSKWSKSYVNNMLRVRKKLHPDIWAVLQAGHAEALDWNRLAEIAAMKHPGDQIQAWKNLCDERAGLKTRPKDANKGGATDTGDEDEEGGEGSGKKRGRPKKGEERKYDDRATTHELGEAVKRMKASGKPKAYIAGALMALAFAAGKGELK